MVRLLALASPMRWHRFARLRTEERRLLAEAGLRLAWAAMLCRLLPFSRAIRSGASLLAPSRPHDPEAVARSIRWAAAVLPFRAVCLQQGLACQAMLRARGADARLHYGIAAGDRLQGHVWVSLGEAVMIGGEEAKRFRSVACFPD